MYIGKDGTEFTYQSKLTDQLASKKYILDELFSSKSIPRIINTGGALMEDCAILLKIATKEDPSDASVTLEEYDMIPPQNIMYEAYLDYEATKIIYFFDPYETFLEDIKGVMEKENWEVGKINETLEKIKEQMKLSEKPYNPAEYTVIPENSIENDEPWTLENPEE